MTRFNRIFVSSALCGIALLAGFGLPVSGQFGESGFYCAVNQTTCTLNGSTCGDNDLCVPSDQTTTFSTCYTQPFDTCLSANAQFDCSGFCNVSKLACPYHRDLCTTVILPPD